MKTSYYLLLTAVLITLTGMVATDVLLKQQYETIDWANTYQFYARRTLPAARYVLIDGTPNRQIIVQSGVRPEALINPGDSLSFRYRMRHDTLHIVFNPDTAGATKPGREVWAGQQTGMILQLPDLYQLQLTNGRLTMGNLTIPNLRVSLRNSVFFAEQLRVSARFDLVQAGSSYALIDRGQYKSVQLTVHDSSVVHIRDARMDAFRPTLSEQAEIQLKGQATRWMNQQGR